MAKYAYNCFSIRLCSSTRGVRGVSSSKFKAMLAVGIFGYSFISLYTLSEQAGMDGHAVTVTLISIFIGGATRCSQLSRGPLVQLIYHAAQPPTDPFMWLTIDLIEPIIDILLCVLPQTSAFHDISRSSNPKQLQPSGR